METCVKVTSKRLAFWDATTDLRADNMNMSTIKKISHKTGKWQINRWCHHKSQKVNLSYFYDSVPFEFPFKKFIEFLCSHMSTNRSLMSVSRMI